LNSTILRTEGLKTYYVLDELGTQKVVQAVDGVDLDVKKNEVYGIAGESGCGKTTLLRALYGDIERPLRLVDGKVFYNVWDEDVDVTALSVEEQKGLRWEFVSYVPQGSMSVFNPVIKISETYRHFITSNVTGKTSDEAFAIAREQITELGMPLDILDAYPHQLSGGMRQRVSIALAALLRPRIIIADEPTTALDVVVQRGVVQLLMDIQRNLENTIILVTHDMGVHANIADRICIMYAGKIVEEAPTETIFEDPVHPYTGYLINSLPRFGDKTTRASTPGSPPDLANVPSGCAFHPRCPHVMDVCREQTPDSIDLDASHRVACWLIGGGNDGQAA
jgi:peptide/nickel transport system ATP-binding protein